jgi:hypothetical protein
MGIENHASGRISTQKLGLIEIIYSSISQILDIPWMQINNLQPYIIQIREGWRLDERRESHQVEISRKRPSFFR